MSSGLHRARAAVRPRGASPLRLLAFGRRTSVTHLSMFIDAHATLMAWRLRLGVSCLPMVTCSTPASMSACTFDRSASSGKRSARDANCASPVVGDQRVSCLYVSAAGETQALAPARNVRRGATCRRSLLSDPLASRCADGHRRASASSSACAALCARGMRTRASCGASDRQPPAKCSPCGCLTRVAGDGRGWRATRARARQHSVVSSAKVSLLAPRSRRSAARTPPACATTLRAQRRSRRHQTGSRARDIRARQRAMPHERVCVCPPFRRRCRRGRAPGTSTRISYSLSRSTRSV